MKRFRKVYVEITNICNMHCSFCPETKRAKATMSKDRFEHIAKQITPYTDYVYLHVKGEPLLHPDLKEILDICQKYNLKVNISTNGTLLKDKVKLLKNIRQLNISVHSFEQAEEQKLEEYIASIVQVANSLAQEGVIIRYKLWNDAKSDDNQINNNKINNNKKILKMLEHKYDVKIVNAACKKDIKLKENIFLSIKLPFKWPEISGDIKQEGKCYGLRQQIAILVDGTIVPCCVDNDGNIDLGNIFETDLKEILNTDKAQKIKRDFENNKCSHELCKKCEYRSYVT